jgi:Flp pilus assembly protein TadG
MGKRSGFLCKLRAFGRATGANVAMMFGLSLLPLAIAASAGMDFANAMMARNQMSDALDAAALALGAQNNLSGTAAQQLAQKVFNANYKGDGSPTVTPTISGQHVSVTASDTVSTTMLSLIGKPYLDISVNTLVVWGQTKLWVALVLDNTGSMSQTDSTYPYTSKISALKTASHNLLTTLQGVAANAGDVQVAIIPFAKDVKFPSSMYTSPNDTSWVDWTDWDSAPANSFWTPSNTVGPGSNCPFTGVGCVTSAGGGSSASTVPSSGLICPGTLTTSTPGGSGHHFQGCYGSVAQSTLTTVTTVVQPRTDQFDCETINGGTASCPESSGYPQNNGNATTTVTTNTTSGYTGDSTTTAGPTTSNSNTSNGSQTCTSVTKKKVTTTTCDWTRTTAYTNTTVTTVKTGANFSHTWASRAHSNWTGCIMDRGPTTIPTGDVPANDYDTNASAPSLIDSNSRFPAEINDSCPVATVLPLSYDWTALSNKIDAMTPNGGTNQGIGMAHGMQALTNVGPYNPGTAPNNTTRYIILLSDGLNTLDRWYGDGSNQSTSVDTREKAACDNAKAQGYIIYTVFVDLGGTQGSSSALQYCATDSSKYYDLTTSGSIVTAFDQIAQQITNLRVAS